MESYKFVSNRTNDTNKTVTSALPVYTMQHERLHQNVIEIINKEQRSFLWGEQDGNRRWHVILWETLCKPNEAGGVGIKSLKLMNEASLLNLLWRMKTAHNTLWVQVLMGKYERPGKGRGVLIAKPSDSALWKEIVKLGGKFSENVEIEVNDGQGTKFWIDKWLKNESKLITYAPNNIKVNE